MDKEELSEYSALLEEKRWLEQELQEISSEIV
jgi:hypothetical protein